MMNIERDSHKYQKKFLINNINKERKLQLSLDEIYNILNEKKILTLDI
jgi:hypothetical protein